MEQHAKYLSYMPQTAKEFAQRSRVAFPHTAVGRLTDECGPYGRQYKDADNRPTWRGSLWYATCPEPEHTPSQSEHLPHMAPPSSYGRYARLAEQYAEARTTFKSPARTTHPLRSDAVDGSPTSLP